MISLILYRSLRILSYSHNLVIRCIFDCVPHSLLQFYVLASKGIDFYRSCISHPSLCPIFIQSFPSHSKSFLLKSHHRSQLDTKFNQLSITIHSSPHDLSSNHPSPISRAHLTPHTPFHFDYMFLL